MSGNKINTRLINYLTFWKLLDNSTNCLGHDSFPHSEVVDLVVRHDLVIGFQSIDAKVLARSLARYCCRFTFSNSGERDF